MTVQTSLASRTNMRLTPTAWVGGYLQEVHSSAWVGAHTGSSLPQHGWGHLQEAHSHSVGEGLLTGAAALVSFAPAYIGVYMESMQLPFHILCAVPPPETMRSHTAWVELSSTRTGSAGRHG